MECWLHDQWPVNGDSNIGMSSFAERQALLKAQVLGSFASGLENYGSFEQRYWPYDQVLLKQQEVYGAVKNGAPVSNWGPDGGFDFGTSNFNEEELQLCGFEFETLPLQMQHFGNFQFISMLDSQDEDYGYAELNLPAWQTQPSLSEVCCRDPSEVYCRAPSAERLTNSSFYRLEDVMKKLPRVSPLLIPTPALSLSIPPSPQFSSDVSLSSCLPFPARVSCPPASLQQSEAETEHMNQMTQLQSCRKSPYASVEPQSVAARHRRSKIREKIRSLEKLIPQGSKLDTARMLDEAIKYLKFLQAQVRVLEDYANSADSKPDLKSNPICADDKANICVKSNFKSENALPLQRSGSLSNFNSDAARKLALTNALALHRSGSGSASSKKLSADQMLHSLLSSSRIQKKLFSAGKIMVTVQQKEKLASTRPDLCADYSNLCFE